MIKKHDREFASMGELRRYEHHQREKHKQLTDSKSKQKLVDADEAFGSKASELLRQEFRTSLHVHREDGYDSNFAAWWLSKGGDEEYNRTTQGRRLLADIGDIYIELQVYKNDVQADGVHLSPKKFAKAMHQALDAGMSRLSHWLTQDEGRKSL